MTSSVAHAATRKPTYYNEIDPYCCRVLRKQIAAGRLPPGDVDERDIRDVRASDLAGYGQIHLFAGIGGIPFGFRMAGLADDFPIITGGFPCQDISNAGKRAGIDGERSGLWSEYARIVRQLRPRYVLVENVAALLGRGIGRVLGDLAKIGYDAEWHCIPAAAVGAPHIRDRVFILAYAQCEQPERRGESGDVGGTSRTGESTEEKWERVRDAALYSGSILADSAGCGCSRPGGQESNDQRAWEGCEAVRTGLQPEPCCNGRTSDVSDTNSIVTQRERASWQQVMASRYTQRQLESHRDGAGQHWSVEPNVGRVAHGIPARVDRLRGLGNACVPQVVQYIAEQLMLSR